ncbi:uncharacterized protein CXQ87_004071 [Candidozyma duobushaemuli]|uniref:Uncharacterized protein n=1 Tax=Candidozyma duobushaemuli TaxID=1231522 RepID=A0A2V1AH38_9ASCO|nr:uncharacterized protein CXQ87_004071 [[Candida] duobushaemulonis]PVH16201.1 hypothetical protein CXQ87_004071 [[Candida] duobushaemulonis]
MDSVPLELQKLVLWRTVGVFFAVSFLYLSIIGFFTFSVLPRYKVPENKRPPLSPRPSFLSRGSFQALSASNSPESSPQKRKNGFYQQPNNSSRYLRRDSFGAELRQGYLVGHRSASAVVVVQFFREIPPQLGDLSVVAVIDRSTEGLDGDGNTYTSVSFSPPNLRNLEYFTVDAILLQSTGSEKSPRDFAEFGKTTPSDAFDDEVLEKINCCQSDRATLNRLNKRSWRLPAKPAKWLPSQILQGLHFLVSCIISILVCLLDGLNYPIMGTSLVEVSAFFRQLDLRLRQVAYFPAQFLFYRNSAILTDPSSDWPHLLQLPSYNEKYNINNSNYINLYNSIWLIVNDILIGITVYRLASQRAYLVNFLNINILSEMALKYLRSLVLWVASEHPYGFKLNDELGKFMGSMFIWTLDVWTSVFDSVLEIASKKPYSIVLAGLIKCICYMGVSFSIAAFTDYIAVVTLHIHFFTIVTTKVYHRQTEALKSLWQLFRGKKYNVLRHRIDNLDEEQFRVDRLLLGTLLFTILVYLLPTTFAFYLLFYAAKAIIFTVAKWCAKLLVVLNMYPLFVLLLKLKNSRRLQGGIVFESLGGSKSTNWLLMSNKALTRDEIFVNFWHVLRNEGKVERSSHAYEEHNLYEVSLP